MKEVGKIEDGKTASCCNVVGVVVLRLLLRQGMEVGDPEGVHTG